MGWNNEGIRYKISKYVYAKLAKITRAETFTFNNHILIAATLIVNLTKFLPYKYSSLSLSIIVEIYNFIDLTIRAMR